MKLQAYLDVGGELWVDSVGSQDVGEGRSGWEAGGHRVGHLGQREHPETPLLVQLLELCVRGLLTLTQDAADHIAALLGWPLVKREGREREIEE